jgi:hypothetical protein
VEHPFTEGESPQWRGLTRSPEKDPGDSDNVRDQGTQTIDLDALFEQKCRALEELEDDLIEANARRCTMHYNAPLPAQNQAELVLELKEQVASQGSSMDALREEVRLLRNVVAALAARFGDAQVLPKT